MINYASLFSGIGGFEIGLAENFFAVLQNEIDANVQIVLKAHFPDIPLHSDIQDLEAERLSSADMIVGGFPCQDVSIVGGQRGMIGGRTVLVEHVFRLAEINRPDWILLEIVQSIRFVHGGRALLHILNRSEELGYRWAYRTLDSRSFGLAQRRRRFYFLASRVSDPYEVLFAEAGPQLEKPLLRVDRPLGFYWTEGKAGHGLTEDAIPPLKAGSAIGIPSPPAVLFPDGRVCTPSIETAEQLQGFPSGWTEAATERSRWTLIGNAVCPPVVKWIASKFKDPIKRRFPHALFPENTPLPLAAFGSQKNGRMAVDISESPDNPQFGSLTEAKDYTWSPISSRALSGFYNRAMGSNLRYPSGFLARIREALRMEY